MPFLDDIGKATVNDALAKLDPLSKALIVGLIQGETTAGGALIEMAADKLHEVLDRLNGARLVFDTGGLKLQIAARKTG